MSAGIFETRILKRCFFMPYFVFMMGRGGGGGGNLGVCFKIKKKGE